MSDPLPPIQLIPTRKLRLDVDNPRYGHLELSSIEASEEVLQAEIEKEGDTIKLYKSIKRTGVEDPIRVQQKEDGTYAVFEGNRRTTCLKKLLREGEKPPAGVDYENVNAHVYPSDYSQVKIEVLKGKLQTGKKGWGASNIAKYVYGLRNTCLMEIEDIAVDMQLSMAEVNLHIENWLLLKEYSRVQNHSDPKQFSYFGEVKSGKIRNWFTKNEENKHAYFDLISPTSGKQKIKGAAFGLRDFNKVVDDPVALDKLINDPEIEMEDALEIVKLNDASKAMPFLKNLDPLAKKIMNLDDDNVNQIAEKKKYKVSLKKLRRAIDQLVTRLDEI